MSYEKLGFEKGQVLKAEHLNHMEDGIARASCKTLTVKIPYFIFWKEHPDADPSGDEWMEFDNSFSSDEEWFGGHETSMTFNDALSAFRNGELADVTVYTTKCVNDYNDNAYYVGYCYKACIMDVSYACFCDCLMFIPEKDDPYHYELYWTPNGFVLNIPYKYDINIECSPQLTDVPEVPSYDGTNDFLIYVNSPAGIKSVTVNGIEATPDGDGRWYATVYRKAGEATEVVITAIDNNNVSKTMSGFVRHNFSPS